MAKQVANPDGASEDGDSVAEKLTFEVSLTENLLASIEQSDVEQMSDEELVNLRAELKNLEDTVEEVRKEEAEAELEGRVEPGEELLGLKRVQSHNKYVDDDVGAVIMRAVSNGVDYTEFVDINASKLEEVAPDIADIGRYEYTYFL